MAEHGEQLSVRLVPAESNTINPAFDVTPSRLVTGIITENGLVNNFNQYIRVIDNE